MQKSSLGCLQQ